jgi:hypothetical protein
MPGAAWLIYTYVDLLYIMFLFLFIAIKKLMKYKKATYVILYDGKYSHGRIITWPRYSYII